MDEDEDAFVNWCNENWLDPDSKYAQVKWAEMMDDLSNPPEDKR